MLRMTLAEVARVTGGRVAGGAPGLEVRGVSTDSRSVEPGRLFVALRGERFDAHDFMRGAFEAGAAAAVVEHEVQGASPLVVVPDALNALGELARAHRARLGGEWIAITGSAGKSTTKGMLAAVLEAAGPVCAAKASYNNLVGVPLTVLEADASCRFAVCELGTNAPGEIARLAEIVQPTMAIWTNVAPAHLAGLGSLEGVATEKATLLDALGPDGLAVLNADDARVMAHAKRAARVATFGFSATADVRPLDFSMNGSGRSRFALEGGAKVVLPLPGRHNAYNALAAAVCARALGVPPVEIARRLAGYEPLAMRSAVHEAGDVLVLDDAYNANPASFAAALEVLAHIGADRRLVVVAGEMLELGEGAPALHRKLGERIAAVGPAGLLAVGALASEIAAGAVDAGLAPKAARTAADADEAAALVTTLLRPGDAVLVKGSRAVHLERVTDAIRRVFGSEG